MPPKTSATKEHEDVHKDGFKALNQSGINLQKAILAAITKKPLKFDHSPCRQ